MVRLHLSEDKLWEGQESGDTPDTQASQFAVEESLFLQVLGLGDLYNSNVAVHANAGEQKHAAEEVDFIDGRHYFAQTDAKVPALGGVDGPEGQHAQEEEVRHSQVEQIHVGHCFQAAAHHCVDPNHQEVAYSTKDEDDPVKRGFVLPSKCPDPASLAHAIFRQFCFIVKVIKVL